MVVGDRRPYLVALFTVTSIVTTASKETLTIETVASRLFLSPLVPDYAGEIFVILASDDQVPLLVRSVAPERADLALRLVAGSAAASGASSTASDSGGAWTPLRLVRAMILGVQEPGVTVTRSPQLFVAYDDSVLVLRTLATWVIRTEASDDDAGIVGPLAVKGQPADTPPPTSAPPAGDPQPLLDALTAGTLDRDRLAAAATTLLKVPETGYVAYLTRTFGVREPESLSDAQLKKEIEFLLRRTQHPDHAERFRMQCARLAQPAA
jgi:hypothetical protein